MNMFDMILDFIKSVKFYGPIIVIVVCLIIYTIIAKIIDKANINGRNELDKKKRLTVILLIKNIIKYIIFILGFLNILSIYGVNTGSILAGLGVIGAVVGLAFQDALKDIISGVNIILDSYFIVGDLVTLNDFTGYIEEFGLKSTKIRGLKGDMLIVANRNIDKIINLSQRRTCILLNIPTAYEEDHKKVEKVLNEAIDLLKENKNVLKDDTKYLGINDFGASSISYLIQIKCVQGTHYGVRREALKLIKESYEKHNIKIPYDQIEVHHGKDI